jgi:hypothetical protein
MALLAGQPVGAQAQGMTGNDLWNERQQNPGIFYGYVGGVADGMMLAWGLDNKPQLFCFPEGRVTHREVGDIVANYLLQHPEWRYQSSTPLVLAALSTAFPCQGGTQ